MRWVRSTQARALGGWRGEAARLAVKRERREAAEAHDRRRRLLSALGAWREAADGRRTVREGKARRLREMRGRLGRGKAARVLAAWVELHSQAVMAAFQVGEQIFRCLIGGSGGGIGKQCLSSLLASSQIDLCFSNRYHVVDIEGGGGPARARAAAGPRQVAAVVA